jgi:gluconolactonase
VSTLKTIPQARVLAEGLAFPEGPAFDQQGRLWFVELKGGNLCCHHQDEVRRFPTGGAPNGAAVDHCGRVWFCDAGQRSIRIFDPKSESFETVCDQVDGQPLNKPNDLAFDASGNLLFTCPGDSRTEPTGYVCCRRPDGTVTKIKDGLFFPNGLALLDEGRTLVVAETYRQRLWRGAWDVTTATWINPCVWSEGLVGAPGPDGMALADDGTLWVAVYGSGTVVRIGPDGDLISRLNVSGKNPANCAFDPSGSLGLVVTEAETGKLLAYPVFHQPAIF